MGEKNSERPTSNHVVKPNAANDVDPEQHDTKSDTRQDVRDRGWAWVVVTANFIAQFIMTGLLSSLGVYLVEWEKQLTASVTQLSWVLSLHIGLTLASGKPENKLRLVSIITVLLSCSQMS